MKEVVVEVRGGNIVAVYSNSPDVIAFVLDHDNADADHELALEINRKLETKIKDMKEIW